MFANSAVVVFITLRLYRLSAMETSPLSSGHVRDGPLSEGVLYGLCCHQNWGANGGQE